MSLMTPHYRDGMRAALAGRPVTDCPWKPGTVGGTAWLFGWNAGRLMRPVTRPLAFLATLAAVVFCPARFGDVEPPREDETP